MLKRIKAWCYNSATIAWGYAQVLISSVLLGFSQLGDIVNNPDVKSAVSNLGLKPVYLFAFAVVGAITIMCRMRTVTKPTDENNQVVE